MASFEYKLSGRGSATATLSDGRSSISLYPSYLSDTLGDLADAITNVLGLSQEARFSWVDEPGTWRWILQRDGERLYVTILWFDETFARVSAEKGDVVFSGEFELLRLAVLVRGSLRQLLNEHGEEGYKELWGYEFPISEYRKLDEAIRKKKQSSK